MNDIQVITELKARKAHQCCECDRMIVPGTVYKRMTPGGKFKMCLDCYAIYEAVRKVLKPTRPLSPTYLRDYVDMAFEACWTNPDGLVIPWE